MTRAARFARRLGVSMLALTATMGAPTIARADDGVGHDCAAWDAGVRRERVQFRVTLDDGHGYTIVGDLYYRGSPENKVLQLAIHGDTWSRGYWDVPTINGINYSYANYMARHGYAVLAIDQLGAGESDRPDGDFLTAQENALSIHQLITQLRQPGNPTHARFRRVVLVSYTFGAVTAIYEQGTWNDADGLVITGQSVIPHAFPFQPEDFAGVFDHPYATLTPEVRARYSYYLPAADPAVIAYDQAHLASTISRGDLLSGFAFAADPVAQRAPDVTAPVLIQIGEFDTVAPYNPAEAAQYSHSRSATLELISGVGHALNLHRDHFGGWHDIDTWIDTHVEHGRGPGHGGDDDHDHGFDRGGDGG